MAANITSFGEYLRKMREGASLTLREVAANINMDSSLLAKIERNERNPTKQQIEQIAVFFKVDGKALKNEYVSDQIAYKIIAEGSDINTLRVAEQKVEYLKTKTYGETTGK